MPPFTPCSKTDDDSHFSLAFQATQADPIDDTIDTMTQGNDIKGELEAFTKKLDEEVQQVCN